MFDPAYHFDCHVVGALIEYRGGSSVDPVDLVEFGAGEGCRGKALVSGVTLRGISLHGGPMCLVTRGGGDLVRR